METDGAITNQIVLNQPDIPDWLWRMADDHRGILQWDFNTRFNGFYRDGSFTDSEAEAYKLRLAKNYVVFSKRVPLHLYLVQSARGIRGLPCRARTLD